MNLPAWLTLATILLVLVLLTRERYPASLVIMAGVVALMLLGVIDAAEAFQGFSNPAPITVAALFVLARAIQKTGALQPLVSATLGKARSPSGVLPRLLFPAAGASAFLNNTPIVAMLVPQITHWANRHQQSPSAYLMPLSYAAMFGGMATLIGTSTNLLVAGLLEAQGLEPLSMFELSRLGVPIALGGVLLLIALAPVLLPDRIAPREAIRRSVREFTVSLNVDVGGFLDGKAVESGGLRNLHGVFLVQIDRGSETIAPVTPKTVLRGGDRLTFVGRVDDIVDLHTIRGLVSAEQTHLTAFDSAGHTFLEAVVGPTSPLIGRTLKQVGFRERYQAAAVAIHRAGHQIRAKLGSIPLRAGDTFLLLADPGFTNRWRDRSDFLLISRFDGTPPASTKRAWIPAVVALAMVIGAGLGLFPILHLAVVAALLVIGLGVLTPGEARSAIDLDVILVIAGGFGLGAAVLGSGLGDVIAGLIGTTAGALGPRGALLGLLVTTVILKSVITNNAAAVLMFPIYLATAEQLSLNPRPLAIALAIVASASFLTPMAYQTNLMVWGPGGYRFRDYAILGTPLVLYVVIALTIFIPVLFPL